MNDSGFFIVEFMKLGIVIPTSRIYPKLTRDFIDGVKYALKENGLEEEVELLIEGIGNGTEKSRISSIVNKLGLQEQVDAIILFSNIVMLENALEEIEALEIPTIITNMGGNIINFFGTREYVFTNSFGLWESAYSAAKYGVENFGKKVSHGSYFYEAGYRMYESFCIGLKEVEGEVAYNQVSQFNPDPNDFGTFVEKAKEDQPDFLYMLYSERDAVGFMQKWSVADVKEDFPVVSSGVLINDEILEKVNSVSGNVHNISSWDLCLPTDENKSFTKAYKEYKGKDANYFSLLGYECTAMISLASKSDVWTDHPADRAKAIKEVQFSGPRGKMNFDNEDHSTHLKQHVFALKNGKREFLETIGVMDNRSEVIKNTATGDVAFNSWHQPYLCQ